MLFAHIKDGKVFREVELDPTKIPDHKKLYLKPIWRDPMPAINDVLQVNDGRTVTIEATRVVYGWKIRNKTVAEKTEETARKKIDTDRRTNDDINHQIGKALFAIVNQVRLLNSKPVLTPVQFKKWVKGL